MRRQKRDKTSTLFNRGFQAGLEGKSMSTCPVTEAAMRSFWMNGWREGRDAHWQGQSGVSAIQANPSFH